MTKNHFYLLIILLCQFSFSQTRGTKPDYKKIKSAVENKNGNSYYPKLMARMKDGDKTLTAEDFVNLYYGYTFQKAYEPYSTGDEKLKQYFEKDTLIEADYQPFIKIATKSLENEPFDLRVMNMLAYVYHLNKEEDMAVKTAFVIDGIINTIVTSGDGLTCDTAFHVISVSDEYVILNIFQLESQSQSLVGNCDFLSFEKGKYKIEGLYFDVSKLFESMMGKR